MLCFNWKKPTIVQNDQEVTNYATIIKGEIAKWDGLNMLSSLAQNELLSYQARADGEPFSGTKSRRELNAFCDAVVNEVLEDEDLKKTLEVKNYALRVEINKAVGLPGCYAGTIRMRYEPPKNSCLSCFKR